LLDRQAVRGQQRPISVTANIATKRPFPIDPIHRALALSSFECRTASVREIHIRSSNVIESSFATIRHRTDRIKGCLTRDGMLAMIYKLGQSAERSWRRLRGFEWLAKVVDGVKFRDGVEVQNVVHINRKTQPARVAA
jgi:hypothetical protein